MPRRDQLSCQRLSGLRPACTIRTTELTIIDRASWASLRPASSEAITRSAAEGAVAALALAQPVASATGVARQAVEVVAEALAVELAAAVAAAMAAERRGTIKARRSAPAHLCKPEAAMCRLLRHVDPAEKALRIRAIASRAHAPSR
jgi:hypothetical protein